MPFLQHAFCGLRYSMQFQTHDRKAWDYGGITVTVY